MNREESRWAQLVYWDEPQILELHRREDRLVSKLESLIKANKSPCETWDLGFIERMAVIHQLSPFWPATVPEAERKVRMDQWKRAIYPIWRGLTVRAYPGAGEDFSLEGCFDDTDLLHRADIAIYRSGLQPMQRGISGAAQRAAESRGKVAY